MSAQTIGWCFVCERDGVVLEPFRQHDGRPALACADQQDCLDAYVKGLHGRPRARKASR